MLWLKDVCMALNVKSGINCYGNMLIEQQENFIVRLILKQHICLFGFFCLVSANLYWPGIFLCKTFAYLFIHMDLIQAMLKI